MRITSANDVNGDVIRIGTTISAWLGGKEYIAKVTGFEHYQGNVVRVTATREDDGTEIKAFSDAVARVRS